MYPAYMMNWPLIFYQRFEYETRMIVNSWQVARTGFTE